MNYLTKLRKSAELNNSVVSLSLDPVMEKIPMEGKPDVVAVKFFSDILAAMSQENTRPGGAKLNYAIYASHGFPGLRALKRMIAACKKEKIPVILDAKRAEYGVAADALAKELFTFWNPDAATIIPFFGKKSMQSFLSYCEDGKGVYFVNRTAMHDDLQNLDHEGLKMFMRYSHRIVEWYTPGIGSVFSGENKELENLASYFQHSKKEVPFLIQDVEPGLAAGVADILRKINPDLALHRLNCENLVYAYEKERMTDYAGAAVKALARLNKEINFVRVSLDD